MSLHKDIKTGGLGAEHLGSALLPASSWILLFENRLLQAEKNGVTLPHLISAELTAGVNMCEHTGRLCHESTRLRPLVTQPEQR
jgi:hypothetical protein